ncbi:MAG: hypothetical protein WED83_01955 [Acidimicrobiia bacterium]
MSDNKLPREPPEDIKEKQDPEYDEGRFRLDLYRVTKTTPRKDEDEDEDEVTPPPSEHD